MNNKGFGLADMIIFIVVSLIVLIICVVYYDNKFGNKKINDNNTEYKIIGESNTKEQKQIEEKIKEEEKLSKEEKKYNILKEKLINAATLYVSEKYTGITDKMIINLNTLIELNYIEQLNDPFNDDITCNGYIIYNGVDKYDVYLKCGEYVSENYNVDFE